MFRGISKQQIQSLWFALLVSLCALCGSSPASAQVNTYNNSTTGTIVDLTSPQCTPVFARTFNVSTSYIISDVDVGVLFAHTYRSDVRVTIKSPLGTVVQLLTNTGGGAQNFNVRFSDQASAAISTHTTNDGTTSPYQRSFKPQSALSVFNTQNAQGLWTLEICDTVAADSGTFMQADLFITPVGTPLSDLSLTKTINTATPSAGAQIIYTLTATNAAGSSTATGINVTDILPLGTIFASATGTGSYNSSTGVWSVGTLTADQSVSMAITANVTASAGVTITNSAEISTSSNSDPDSFVNNGSTTEDDYAAINFTVAGTRTAGTPPSLVCPIGTVLFDWDTKTWAAGSLSNTFVQAGIGSIGFVISSPALFVNDATFGGQSPTLTNLNTGGLSPAQLSLHQYLDFADTAQTATTVITLPTAVPGAQFTVFDIDYSSGAFADKLNVTGSLAGATVTPTLTNGIANYTIGNNAIGDATSANGQGNGNVVVTFTSAIDKITIAYGNGTGAPTNPTGQAIAIHDINFCAPMTNIAVTKTSAPYDDGVNPVFNIPNNDVMYTINVANTGGGSVTSNSLFIVDALPSQFTFFNGDADGTGPGTNAVNFADSNSGLTWNYATDVGYAITAPTSFAQCNVVPAAGYVANIRYVCFNPKGVMAAKTSATTPSFSVSLRGKIN